MMDRRAVPRVVPLLNHVAKPLVAAGLPMGPNGLLTVRETWIIATAGFNRWMVPPAALCIHLCIGMAYGFSVFWKPLENALVGPDGKPLASCSMAATFWDQVIDTWVRSLWATDCNWTRFELGGIYTFFFVLLGASAAIWVPARRCS